MGKRVVVKYMLTNSPINDIILDDNKGTDFLLSKNWAQSRLKEFNRSLVVSRNVPFLLEDIMKYKRGKHPNSGFKKGHKVLSSWGFQKGNKIALDRKHTKETKEKISIGHRGSKNPNFGKPAWNKGLKNPYSKKILLKMSQSHKGKRLSIEHRIKIGLARKGMKHPSGTGQKISQANRGKNNWNWKGGITPLRGKIWKSLKYKQWRKKIFEQDNYTCVLCKTSNGQGKTIRLEADHYPIPFVYFIKKIKELSNNKAQWFKISMSFQPLWKAKGRTLCMKCHNKTKMGRTTFKKIAARNGN